MSLTRSNQLRNPMYRAEPTHTAFAIALRRSRSRSRSRNRLTRATSRARDAVNNSRKRVKREEQQQAKHTADESMDEPYGGGNDGDSDGWRVPQQADAPELAMDSLGSTSPRDPSLMRQLKDVGSQFSKIASQFSFEPTAAAYMDWTVQFCTELDYHGLADTIREDPSLRENDALARQKQQTVYYMIGRCITVPRVRAVITTSLPVEERTGFGAWRALRTHFIGDERTYLQSLESKFENLRWEAGESWATLETRFETLLSELQTAHVGKQDHQRMARLMKAVQESSRMDAQGTHVFTRLQIVNLVYSKLDYRDWLVAVRTEAQQIQDELAKRGPKRAHEESDSRTEVRRPPLQEVSFVGFNPGASRNREPPKRFHAPGRGPAVCFRMRDTGHCSYGATCNFSHDMAEAAGTGHGNNNTRGGNSARGGSNGRYDNRMNDIPCRDFARGRCTRGASCRFSHAQVSSGAAAAPEGPVAKREVLFAEVYAVQNDRVIIEAGAQQRSHRIIGDSGASVNLTPRREYIHNLLQLDSPMEIRGAFGRTAVATHGGEGRIPMGGGAVLVVPDMVLCESLRDTLLCLCKLVHNGHKVLLHPKGGGVFVHRTGEQTPLSTRGNIVSFEIDEATAAATAEVHAITRAMRQSEPETGLDADDAMGDDGAHEATASASEIPASSILAHARSGHLCGRKLDQLIEHEAADGLVVTKKHAAHKLLIAGCEACQLAKARRSAFGKEIDHAAHAPNDLAVADVVGPITVRKAGATGDTNSENSEKFYLSVVTDVFSRHMRATILPDKRPSDHVISYMHSTKIQTGRDLKRFHTDGGKEYNAAERALEARGVKVTRTPVHTPQWNAIAERKNRTLMEMARAFLLHAGLEPDAFWQFAVETAVFTHNRVTVVNPHGKTAHELFTGRKPDLSRFRVFGCDAFVRRAEEHPGKLAPRAEKGIFVGYDVKREGAWRVWVDGEVVISRDVTFQEQQFEMAKRHGSSNSTNSSNNSNSNSSNSRNNSGDALEERIAHCIPGEGRSRGSEGRESDSEDSAPQHEDSDQTDLATRRQIAAAEKNAASAAAATAGAKADKNARHGKRTRKQTRRDGLNPDDFGPRAFAVSNTAPDGRIRASDVPIPASRRAALKGPHATEWQEAMESEIASIQEHNTWELVESPGEQINLVTSKWVFAVKEKDGFVVRFKARLVARGFTQQYGVDYEETYASVVRFKALRILLAVVAMLDLVLELMDVKTAYLNAPLKERVFMRQPEGFERMGAQFVCLLKKALYGLKQSGREWWQHLHAFLLSLGFKRCASDTCVYVRMSRGGRPIILAVYVDDIPAAFDEADRAEWEEIKATFARRFSISFLGDAEWLLNMRITRDRTRRMLWLDQHSYVASMLEEFSLDEARSVAHPGAQTELSVADCPRTPAEVARMAKLPYRRVIGLLTYLANCTRPDIAFSVNLLAQFSQNPGAAHWRALMQILRYLSGTAAHGLLFDGNTATPHAATAASALPPSTQTVFADANWAGCKDSRRSTTGWLIRVGNSWVDWSCSKQTTVALSSCEAEYMAATSATQGAIWVQQLLDEIGFLAQTNGGVVTKAVPLVLSDNKSAIALAHTDALHSRSKHIDVRHHFIREAIEAGIVQLKWISTHEQVADILTKTLQPRLFAKFAAQLVVPPNQRPAQA